MSLVFHFSTVLLGTTSVEMNETVPSVVTWNLVGQLFRLSDEYKLGRNLLIMPFGWESSD